jgi:hypothetical protein
MPDVQHKEKNIKITVDGYSYYFQTQYKNKNKYFRCSKKKAKKCLGSVTLSQNDTIVRKRFHTCGGLCKVEDKTLEEVYEYEETCGRFKINGYFYNFNNESRNKNKYYQCFKKNSQKCRGSITISPNRQIIKRAEHTCQCQDQISEEVQEYEETDGRLKINGHNYNFRYESRTGNKYYVCYKINCAIKCRGSITITPDRKIVKKVDHICNLIPS